MQSEQMKIIKDGDTVRVVPVKNIEPAKEADEIVSKMDNDELKTAIKKQADIMKFLVEML